jgi:hypothetical protein
MSSKSVLAGLILGSLAVFPFSIAAQTPSTSFSDPLTGPDSPHIDVSLSVYGDQSYDYTPEGLKRVFKECVEYRPWGPCFKGDRPINKTVSSEFLDDFIAEIHISKIGLGEFDLAFFGYGPGDNPGNWTEPNGFVFRIHATGGVAQQLDVGFWTGSTFVKFDRLQKADWENSGITTWDPVGGETFRIERSGDDLTMSMVGGNSVTYSIAAVAAATGGLMNSTNSRLFFGNGTVGTIFSNFSVQSGSPDGDGDGVPDEEDNCSATVNADQADQDGDGVGDVCDSDVDGDGVANDVDACPGFDDGIDGDGDGIPDGCDDNNNDGPLGDLDGDRVLNGDDLCVVSIGGPVDGDGCSVNDMCNCDTAKNHGNHVSCITKASTHFRKLGLISDREKSSLVQAAAKSSCGRE